MRPADRAKLQAAAGGGVAGYLLLTSSMRKMLNSQVNRPSPTPIDHQESWIVAVGWRGEYESRPTPKSIAALRSLSGSGGVSPYSLVYCHLFDDSKLLILDEVISMVEEAMKQQREKPPRPISLSAGSKRAPLFLPSRNPTPVSPSKKKETPKAKVPVLDQMDWNGYHERRALLVETRRLVKDRLIKTVSQLVWSRVMVGGSTTEDAQRGGMLLAALNSKGISLPDIELEDKFLNMEGNSALEAARNVPFLAFSEPPLKKIKVEGTSSSPSHSHPPPSHLLDLVIMPEMKKKEVELNSEAIEGGASLLASSSGVQAQAWPQCQQTPSHASPQIKQTPSYASPQQDEHAGHHSSFSSRTLSLDQIIKVKKMRQRGHHMPSASLPATLQRKTKTTMAQSSNHWIKSNTAFSRDQVDGRSLLIPQPLRDELRAHYDKAAAKIRRERLAQVTLASSILGGPARKTSRGLGMHEGGEGAGEGFKWLRLKVTQKSLRLDKSKIQGFGLYADEDIEAGEFVVEYVGELIRLPLCDLREKMYRSTGMDDYVFRIDGEFAIDATCRGNVARYINHSCAPNCVTKVVLPVSRGGGGRKHVAIMAKRRILKGEELSYDYKFPWAAKEEDRVPCSCGAGKCKGFMC